MKLNCPKCKAPIGYDDINIKTNYAKCFSCSEVFSFSVPEKERVRYRPEASKPKGLKMIKQDDYLKMIIPGFRFGQTKSFKGLTKWFFLIFFIYLLSFLAPYFSFGVKSIAIFSYNIGSFCGEILYGIRLFN